MHNKNMIPNLKGKTIFENFFNSYSRPEDPAFRAGDNANSFELDQRISESETN